MKLVVLSVVLIAAVTAPNISADATPETALAVQTIREEIAYSTSYLTEYGQSRSAGYLASVAAMNYTVGHVIAPTYGYLVSQGTIVGSNPEQILALQAGICGHAEIVFAQLMAQLGYQVRRVTFVVPGGGHVTAEVLYDGAWHWFDPTFGVYYLRGHVLSIAEMQALKNPSRYAITDQTLLWRQIVTQTKTSAQTGMTLPLSVKPTYP